MPDAPAHVRALEAHRERRFADACAAWMEFLEKEPRNASGWTALGLALVELRDPKGAEVAFRQALAIAPQDTQASLQLGRMCFAQERWQEAAELLGRAVPAAPMDAIAVRDYLFLAQVHRKLGALDRAEDMLRRLAALHPRVPYTQGELAHVLLLAGRREESATAWREALASGKDITDALLYTARSLWSEDRFEEWRWLVDFWRAELARAGRPVVALEFEHLLQFPRAFRTPEDIVVARAEYAKRLADIEANPLDGVDARQLGFFLTPFYAHYPCGDDRPTQASLGRTMARLVARALPEYTRPLPAPAPRPRIRVGFASSHFRLHTVARLFEGWVLGLDRSRFEVRIYHAGAPDGSTATFQKMADVSRPMSGVLAEDAAMLRADELDVLIYPEVGMWGPIQTLSHLRLAPVQAVTWGHPVTTGSAQMDVFLSSDAMEPPDGDSHYTERLVRLPGLSLYWAPSTMPPVLKTRADFGLSEDAFVILCSQSLFKLLPQHDGVRAALLAAIPNAHLVFLRPPGSYDVDTVRARLDDALRAVGVDPAGRVSYLSHLSPGAFLDLNRASDVFLDGLAWSGGQTTLDAVACGLLPVGTVGPYMRMRHTAAILSELGLEELVADEPAGVVPIVRRLAEDRAWGDSLRVRMADALPRLVRDARALEGLEAWIEAEVARVRAG